MTFALMRYARCMQWVQVRMANENAFDRMRVSDDHRLKFRAVQFRENRLVRTTIANNHLEATLEEITHERSSDET